MRNGVDRLLDIQEAIGEIGRYVIRGRDAFLQDELVQVWMVHHLQIIGKQPPASPRTFEALLPAFPGNR